MRAHTIGLIGRLAGAVAALIVLASPAVARADAVTDWNGYATTAIVANARQLPQVSPLSYAMVQGAVYDAVNAIDRRHQPYLVMAAANPGDSKDAAAATAAFRVLVELFPAQLPTLKPLYDASLAAVPDGAAKAGGIAAGEEAAAAMLAARENDGRGGPFDLVIGSEPGEWRPTPPGFLLDPAPWIGNVLPFIVPSVDMLRSDGPNPLTSAAYAEDFNEVKEVGSLTSTTRTADQTDAALFWQTNGPGLWNGVMNTLAVNRGLDSADSSRLFAMANLAMADGVIGCWDDKYRWSFWRPVSAIREVASDGNPATEPDASWTPLFATPPFPDHPSAHSCLSSALVHTLQEFFGTDKIGFSAFSSNSRTTRSFDRLSDAIKEIIDARVWAGIHFRTADVQGAVLGKKVAHYLQKHYFQPAG
jgi:PAP2 superfamily